MSALRSRKIRILRAGQAIAVLKRLYPDAVCSLDSEDAFSLLVSVRLSAQCTDARVNLVTPALFARFPDADALAQADIGELEALIRSCGFYHSKARDLKAAAIRIRDEFGGRVPDTMQQLLSIPGVGRKSANLLLGDLYAKPGAVVADTHCIRISNRLGLCDSDDPYKVELALREILPPDESNAFCHRLVLFGRDVCRARKPGCDQCPLRDICPSVGAKGAKET